MTDSKPSKVGNTGGHSRSRREILVGVVWGTFGIAFAAAALVGVLLFMQWFSDPEGKIRITEPQNGVVVEQPAITIRGTSSPEWAGVYRVLDGGRRGLVAVDEDGNWAYRATLVEGENKFKFHLDSHYGQSASLTIVYRPE